MALAALIIGQIDGLCEAICTQLFALKYRVVVMTDVENPGRSEWLGTGTRDLSMVVCDVKNADELRRHLLSIEQQTGQIDTVIFVSNESSLQSFPEVRKISENMIERGHGRIVVIDSSSPEEGQGKKSGAPQAKQTNFLWELVQNLAAEIKNSGVTVNTITAGRIGRAAGKTTEEIMETEEESQPSTAHLTQQQEIARLIAYLLSDEAAFISGANITVNAGRYMN